jgi:hypothetical protein
VSLSRRWLAVAQNVIGGQQLSAWFRRAMPTPATEAIAPARGDVVTSGDAHELLEHAQDEAARGEPVLAREILKATREHALETGHWPAAYRADVLDAKFSRQTSTPHEVLGRLAGLRRPRGMSPWWRLEFRGAPLDVAGEQPGFGDEPLGPVKRERLEDIAAWLCALSFREECACSPARLRIETALVIAELWADLGQFRSAAMLVTRVGGSFEGLSEIVDNVGLLQVEWLLAAGEFREAADRLGRLTFASGVDGLRARVVAARLALAQGRLAEVLKVLPEPADVPREECALYAETVAITVALNTELNLWGDAVRLADEAIAALGDGPGAARLVAHLRLARHNAAQRGQSSKALWDQPRGDSGSDESEPTALASDLGEGPAVWAAAASGVFADLARGAFAAAAKSSELLTDIARNTESNLIAVRAEFFQVIVEYHSHGPQAAMIARLRKIAADLQANGARLQEAQALRHAAWAAARCGYTDEYLQLSRSAALVLDEIANELGKGTRSLFLRNKWSGRDELVAGRMKELLDGASSRPPSRRALCRAFREIEQLTHWPIDSALDGSGVEASLDETSDLAGQWVRERLADPRVRRRWGTMSPLSLFWFPAGTLVLHYHVLPDRAYLFRIGRRHVHAQELAIGEVALGARNLRASADDAEQMGALAEELGIAAALRRFPRTRRLVIVPHEAVAQIPFAALMVEGKALCEHVAITQIDRIGRFTRGARSYRGGHGLSVGNESYAESGLCDLPAAEDEARAVTAALGGPWTLRVGTAAAHAEVLAALSETEIVHFAAHGYFDRDDPTASGVLLRCDGGYKKLTLLELRQLDLRKVRLATLAWCRSAQCMQLPGRERICVPTALLDAGVGSVIASLWEVHDNSSHEFMTELYQNMRTCSAAVALREVQTLWCGEGRPPEMWAGFVCYGNQ